LTSQFY